MSDTRSEICLNCARSEREIPLISLRYQGNEAWICSQCMPQLIHQPELLADKLSGADSFPATPEL